MSQRRRAPRLLAHAIVAACLAPLALAATSAAAPPDPKQLTLHLPDLPPGYVIDRTGPEGPCSYRTFVDEIPSDVLRIWRHSHFTPCTIALTRIWTAPGTHGPAHLLSTAATVADPAAAAALLDKPRGFAAAILGLRRSRWVPESTTAKVGDETRLLRTGTTSLGSDHGIAVLWRSGAVVAMVLVERNDVAAAEREALRLAAVQQAHIVTPTPLTRRDFDDAEVALEDPLVAVPIHWVGRSFTGGVGLPHVRLLPGEAVDPVDRSEGLEAALSYGHLNRVAFQIDLMRPNVFAGRAARRELRSIQRDRCIRTEWIPLADGSATIFVRRRHCETDAIDGRGAALVQLTDVAMRVGCVDCFPAETHYTSLTGLRAIVRALRLRSPQP